MFEKLLSFRIRLSVLWCKAPLGALGVTLLLSGCGFHPLYQEDIPKDMHNIKINVIAERSGQILRNELIDLLKIGSINPNNYTHTLSVSLKENRRSLGLRRDATSRHTELLVSAVIKLEDNKTKKKVFNDSLRAIASYTTASQSKFGSYSADVAEKNARRRALETLAKSIRLRLAAYMGRRENSVQ